MKKWTLIACNIGLVFGYAWWLVGMATGSQYNSILGLLFVVLIQVIKTQFDIFLLKEEVKKEVSK